MQIIRLNETTAALIEIPFTSVLATNLQSRILGSTLANSGISVWIKKGGTQAAVAGGAGAFTATDDTNAPGVRGYRPAVAELVLGVSTFVFTGTNMEPREVPVMVVNDDPYRPDYYGTATTGTLTLTSFTTDRTEATSDHWKDSIVEFLTGANAGVVKKIGSYNGTTKAITLASGLALPNVPTNGDKFRLITR